VGTTGEGDGEKGAGNHCRRRPLEGGEKGVNLLKGGVARSGERLGLLGCVGVQEKGSKPVKY